MFQVLLSITYNTIKNQLSKSSISSISIKHKSSVCTQFKCQCYLTLVQSAGAVEYTDYTSSEG